MKVHFQRCLRTWFILVLLFGILVNSSSFAQERLTVALLPFVERNGEEAYLGYLIRDWVKRILEQEKTIAICDVFSTDNLVRSSQISWDTLLVSSAAQVLARRLKCDYIVTGSFRHRQVASRDRIIVTPKLHRVAQGDYVDIPSEMFDGGRMDLVARYVAEKVLEILELSPSILEVPSLAISNLLPLYQSLAKVDQAIRTYGENQYPDRPLWREAFSLAEETLKKEPNYREGYYYLANMYRETKWWAKEAETWDLCLKLLNHEEKIDGASIAQVYFRLAYSYLNQKNRELALSYLQKAVNLNPGYVEAYLLLGRMYYEEDNIEEAEKAYSKAYELDPSSKEAQYFVQRVGKARLFGKSAYETYTQGYQSFSRGDLEGAEAYLKEAVRLNPGFKEAYYWLGRTLYEMGKLEEAEKVWEKILEIDPFHSQVRRFLDKTQQEIRYGREAVRYFQKGYELYEDGDYEGALEPLKKAILQNPAFSEAHEYLARCYYRLGKTKEYVEEREKVTQLLTAPEDKGWYAYNTGYELFSWNEKEKAKEWLEKAVSQNPHLGGAHLLLGEIYREKKDWSVALTHYLKARDALEGEEKGRALWGMVTALFELQRFRELLPILEELILSYPYADFIEEAEALRIEILVREKEYREARLAFQQFQIQFPQSQLLEKTSFFYALSFYEEKQWQETLTVLERFQKRYPQSDFMPQAIEMLGYVYRNLGKEEEARKAFEKLKGDEGSFLVADTWYRRKEWDQAIAGFTQYLSRYPEGKFVSEAHLKLASLYLEKGVLEEAEKMVYGFEDQLEHLFPIDFLRFRVKLNFQKGDWRKVVDDMLLLEEETGRLEEEYLMTLALAYYRLGERERAKEILKQAGKNPEEILKSEEAELLKKALEAMERGDYVTVLSEIKEGNTFQEHGNLVHFLLGKAHYFLNQFDEAYTNLIQSVSSEESFVQEAYFYLLDLAYRREEWSKVVEFYQKLGESCDTEVCFRVAMAYYKLENLSESRKILEELVAGGNHTERIDLLLLEVLYGLKDYRAFLELVPEFLDSYPHHPEREVLLYLASWSAYLAGDMDQSKSFISQYHSEYYQGKYESELLSLEADIKIEENAYDEAVTILEELLQKKDLSLGKQMYTWYRLGTIFVKEQDFQRAVDAFQNVTLGGENTYFDRAAYYLGVCWEYLENTKEACQAYQLVIERGKDSIWKSKAEERFRLLTQE